MRLVYFRVRQDKDMVISCTEVIKYVVGARNCNISWNNLRWRSVVSNLFLITSCAYNNYLPPWLYLLTEQVTKLHLSGRYVTILVGTGFCKCDIYCNFTKI